MPIYRVYGAPVRNKDTGEIDPALVGQEITVVTRGTTTPFDILDLADDPIPGSVLAVASAHVLPVFGFDAATPTTVYLDWYHAASGNRGPIYFEEVDRQVAGAALAAANAAVKTVNGVLPDAAGDVIVTGTGGGDGTAVTWSTLTGKPSTFPPSGHTHLRSEVSDATTVGRAVMGAADALAARTAIGAGTGNGTSNLVLGTTATTAAPGNHTHSQYVDSAQAAAIADEQIAAAGGVSGGGGVYPWRYISGAYPTLPTAKPDGVVIVAAIGPVAPSVLPSWVGTGPTQVPSTYDYAPLT